MKTTINQVILQLSCFFFIPLWMNAQSGLLLSLNGGVSNSKIRYANLVNFKTTNNKILGYQGGVNVGWQFSKRFTLLSGLFIIQKGTKFAEENKAYQDDSNGGQVYLGFLTGEEKTSFYSIPIVGRFKIIGNRFGLLASAGLSLNKGRDGTAFKYVQANSGKVFAGRYEMVEFGEDIDQLYTPFQVGFIMGLGVQIPVSANSRILLNTTLDLGMTDALNQRYKQANTIFEKAYNRSTLFSIGYEYHFSIKDLY
jgi:Outer membrane protein beta-barrel domain